MRGQLVGELSAARAGAGKLVVRATHVEAPSLDGDRSLEPVDPWAEDPRRTMSCWRTKPSRRRRGLRRKTTEGADPSVRAAGPRISPLKGACASM